MKTTEEIEAKIVELRKIGSPSALSKVSELSWTLGIEDAADEEADMLTDLLLGSREPSTDLWSELPEYVRDHFTYAFDPLYDAVKKLVGKLKAGLVLTDDEEEDLRTWQSDLETKQREVREEKIGKILADFRKKNDRSPTDKEYSELVTDAYSGVYSKIPDVESDIEKAVLMSSKAKNGKHRPILDLDLAAHVIPSSTKGHGHLYIDKELTWKQYQKLLNVLADLDIIEKGYRGASLARGYTAVRLPWVKKTDEEMKESEEKRKKNK